MNSFQYWLGGSSDNLENFLLMISKAYVPALKDMEMEIAEPVTFPDTGIWHPIAPDHVRGPQGVLQLVRHPQGYRPFAKDCPRRRPRPPEARTSSPATRLTTSGMVMDLEARGAKVVPIFAGGLDFSCPVERFFFDPITKGPSSTPCSPSPASPSSAAPPAGPPQGDRVAEEAQRAVHVRRASVLPDTEEWKTPTLGLHPVQVALQVRFPSLTAPSSPIIFSGREASTGQLPPLRTVVDLLATAPSSGPTSQARRTRQEARHHRLLLPP